MGVTNTRVTSDGGEAHLIQHECICMRTGMPWGLLERLFTAPWASMTRLGPAGVRRWIVRPAFGGTRTASAGYHLYRPGRTGATNRKPRSNAVSFASWTDATLPSVMTNVSPSLRAEVYLWVTLRASARLCANLCIVWLQMEYHQSRANVKRPRRRPAPRPADQSLPRA
jgi:hypothetical protein